MVCMSELRGWHKHQPEPNEGDKLVRVGWGGVWEQALILYMQQGKENTLSYILQSKGIPQQGETKRSTEGRAEITLGKQVTPKSYRILWVKKKKEKEKNKKEGIRQLLGDYINRCLSNAAFCRRCPTEGIPKPLTASRRKGKSRGQV